MIMRLCAIALLMWPQAAPPQTARVMTAVRAAVAPALPFPQTDAAGSVPVDNNTVSLWMVRPLQPDDTIIEVFANPLNQANQARATQAMRQIENNIESAQRRAAVQYEQAIAEAKRTGRSQEVDGVTLNDEGVAGERIDAESRVEIDVRFNEREYRFTAPGRSAPARAASFPHANAALYVIPAHVYKDEAGIEHFAEAQHFVFLGPVSVPQWTEQDAAFAITATAPSSATAAISSIAIRLRGNSDLVTAIAAKTNWAQLQELLR